jgi:CubicO group peptidase (beta-lactamase class C family)
MSQRPRIDRSVALQAIDYFGSWLAFRQQYLRIPGVQAAFLLGDEVLFSAAYGLADVEADRRLTTSHLFRIASHSKTFTATAVLQLAEQGRLRLDDPAGSRLPWLAEAGSPLATVTLRELLAHAGGLVRDGRDGDHWQSYHPFPDAEQLQAIALEAGAAVLSPNERFKYSNIGYSLLGAVIEQASGEPYNAYVRGHVVDALGLQNTGPELDPARLSEYATGYSALAYAESRVPIEHVDTRAMASATGFYSTAEDVVRYFAGHFTGDGRLLSDASKRQMRQRLWDVGIDDHCYGLGLALTTIGDRTLIGHGGGYPGHITSTLADPEDRFAVSVLTNAIDGPAEECVLAAVRLLDVALKVPPTDQDLRRFTGRFASLWGVADIAQLGGRLYLIKPTAADPTDRIVELDVVDDVTLRFAGGTGFGSYGEPLACTFDDQGRVSTLRADSGMTFVPLERLRLPGAG